MNIDRKNRSYHEITQSVLIMVSFLIIILSLHTSCSKPWYENYNIKTDKQLKDRTNIPTLINALNDKDWTIRVAAANALGNFGDEASDSRFALEKAMEDPVLEVRMAAAAALSKVSTVSDTNISITILIRDLVDGTYSKARAAAKKLGQMGSEAKPALPALMRAATLKRSWPVHYARVRIEAIRALGEIGPDAKSALPTLMGNLKDIDARVRAETVLSLVKIDPLSEDIISKLNVMVNDDPAIQVKVAVAIALGEAGPVANVAAYSLIKNIENDKAWRVRAESAKALGKIGLAEPAILDTLVATTENHTIEVRVEALLALGRIGLNKSKDLFPAVFVALHDEDVDVRMAALKAIAMSGITEFHQGYITWEAYEGADNGYSIYYGRTPADLSRVKNVGNVTEFDISQLKISSKSPFYIHVVPNALKGSTGSAFEIPWKKPDVFAALQQVAFHDEKDKVKVAAFELIKKIIKPDLFLKIKKG